MVCKHKGLTDVSQLRPAELAAVCEFLLYTMGPEQRQKLAAEFPAAYRKITQCDAEGCK